VDRGEQREAPNVPDSPPVAGAVGLPGRLIWGGRGGVWIEEGGSTRPAALAPLTAIILLFEMTDDYRVILPVMVATVVAIGGFILATTMRRR